MMLFFGQVIDDVEERVAVQRRVAVELIRAARLLVGARTGDELICTAPGGTVRARRRFRHRHFFDQVHLRTNGCEEAVTRLHPWS